MKLRYAMGLALVPAILAVAGGSDWLQSGWESFQLSEYNRAVQMFERAGENPAALYGLATAWALRRPGEDVAKAMVLYRRVVELAPNSDTAAWSLFALARLQHNTATEQTAPDWDAVRHAYQDVIDRFPKHAAGEEAFLFQQMTWLAIPNPTTAQPAVAALENFVATHPQSPYRSAAWRLIAHGYLILGNAPKQLTAWQQRLATLEPAARHAMDLVGAYYRIANLAEFECGDFSVAQEFYQHLIQEFPNDQRVFIARQELQRMAALLAEWRR